MEQYTNKSNTHIKPIDRKDATLEAENGETVLTCLSEDGMPELLIIDGKPHSQGGTPLSLPDDSFIYSKYKHMKIKDKSLQDDFMMKYKKSGYTPAEISKKYAMNKERDILRDKDSSDLEKHTAELMIKNKTLKLGELALAQESLKAYDDGIPFVSIPYMESVGIGVDDLYPEANQEQQTQIPMEQPMMAQTGIRRIKRFKSGGQVYQNKGEVKTYTDDEINQYDWGFKDKNKWITEEFNHSKALGKYGSELITFKEFFKSHPDLLDKLFNIWKTNDSTKDYAQKLNDKNKFLDFYCNWLLAKQSWQSNKEGGKGSAYWDEVVKGSRAQNGKELKRRNTREYADAFQKFAGLNTDMIKSFQSMDYAMNEFAKTDDGKKYGFKTNDIWEEDENSNAGASSSTEQNDRKGVSIIDGFFGQRTADFLPFVSNPNPDNNTDSEKDSEKEKPKVDAEHLKNKSVNIPNDWFIQDKNNLGLALNERMNILEPRPYMPQVGYEEGTPHYIDYRTDAARVASNAASIANGMGMSADPYQDVVMASALNQSANDSVMKLQQQEQAQNVNIANQYDRFNTQQRNAHYAAEADLDKKYYDETQIGRQQKRNAINKANQNIVNTVNNGITNAARAYNESLIDTQGEYFIDPYTNRIERNPYYEENINPSPATDDIASYTKNITTLASSLGISNKEAADIINSRYSKQKEAADKNAGLAALARMFNNV